MARPWGLAAALLIVGSGCVRFGFGASDQGGDAGGSVASDARLDGSFFDTLAAHDGPLDTNSSEGGGSSEGLVEKSSAEHLALDDGAGGDIGLEASAPPADAWVTPQGTITTFAGTGTNGSDDGPVATATFHWPWNLDVDAAGRVYVADYLNHKIRLIENGQVSTLAGSGSSGFADGAADTAQFAAPHDVAVGADGAVYVADTNNYRVRMIKAGQVSTLAGDGTNAFMDGPAVSARFTGPHGLDVDPVGRVYVMDGGSPRIRLIDAGQVSTFAGDGTIGERDGPAASAQFADQGFVAVDGAGRVFVSSIQHNSIRLIENGQVSTFAGTGAQLSIDGPVATASFAWPTGIALDAGGHLYVIDFFSHQLRVIAEREVITVAGSGVAGFADGPAGDAQFDRPVGVAVGPKGEVYIADPSNSRIRVFTPTP